ncbi:metallo-beta-lactamase [Candidatus Termititenax persephonae]|uniref:Metallo-beta-lactamase n=1 Tax=Candidatus Termititenax persephonae TaxID=2218525 RepID=A0A388TIJ6_9BACT|nr:metallo-beta-lactamase [Candidatus Termititenax persephonae]
MLRKISDRVFAVGVNDFKRKLFDALVPLPDGTSYNSYLVKGEKTAVIDAVDPPFAAEWLKNIQEADCHPDYIIANHAEQDHSGALVDFLRAYPGAKVVTNAKCRDLLIDLLHIPPENFLLVEDRAALDLGGVSLEFYFAPWVHWPETMFTLVPQEKILFTTDFLGAHYASDDLYVRDEALIYRAAKRYYAEIMMPFRTNVRRHLELVRTLVPKIIAPSHGQVYHRPDFILSAYAEWASEDTKDALILYVSMHDSVRHMTEIIRRELEGKNIAVRALDLSLVDSGEVAMELVGTKAVLLGTPMVLAGAHPVAANAVFLFNALRPPAKYLGLYGSYSWGGRAVEQLSALLTAVQPEILPPQFFKGLPRPAEDEQLAAWARDLAAKL